MTVASTLLVSQSYYDFDHLERVVRSNDSILGRIECDYPCLAVTLPHAIGKKLHQKFTVIEFQDLHQQINEEVPSIEAKMHIQHKKRVLSQVAISIICMIIGIVLLKNSDLGSGNGIAGLLITIGSGAYLLTVLVHSCGQIDASIAGLNKTITAFGEVLGCAKALQSTTNQSLSMPLKDWYKHFRAVHFKELPLKNTAMHIEVVVENRQPLLPNHF